jgi:membrane-bound lytic murein transglycosylase MltF
VGAWIKKAEAPALPAVKDVFLAARAAWEAEGWTIIATISDQESDLGPHAERGLKLPNPFYKVP